MEKIIKAVKDFDCFFRTSELFTYEDLEKVLLRELARKRGFKIGIVKTILKYNATWKISLKRMV